ncbi:hypothetical protein ACFYXF_13280 [Streptomyces sp. NPDC002680]|uniref:hypothetical protein n=1 Tax=Streptomyces sp. NPDC002680 TaxID=3364659 RepID=UPI0036BC283F
MGPDRRAVVQRVPYNGGDGYTVTLLPPSNTAVSAVSTSTKALIHQWTCDPASTPSTKKNWIWRLLGKT